ncbi:hypothetical protein VL15_28920 [Burkholderia cepacia]|uniref:Uncharacterized protein n=1 Tax=Burkholderia cepacia TaxID=292 RepID=A0A0J5WB80_BURCE|nr:hypothetical protein VL15_28920 [Burkholderia cepacia]
MKSEEKGFALHDREPIADLRYDRIDQTRPHLFARFVLPRIKPNREQPLRANRWCCSPFFLRYGFRISVVQKIGANVLLSLKKPQNRAETERSTSCLPDLGAMRIADVLRIKTFSDHLHQR